MALSHCFDFERCSDTVCFPMTPSTGVSVVFCDLLNFVYRFVILHGDLTGPESQTSRSITLT